MSNKLCKTCIYREDDGYCSSEKLMESPIHDDKEMIDMLVHPYTEGGGFWVGENFGCVHHKYK